MLSEGWYTARMHVEIKAAMFNFVTDDKSHGQPNKYFRTHFFSYKRFAPNFTKMEKNVYGRDEKRDGQVIGTRHICLFRLTVLNNT